MEPRHYLRCLGHPVLVAPSGDAVRIRVRKHLALLIYMAVEPRTPQRRARLVELLWPGEKRDGRHSLSTALSVLRARLGPDSFECVGDQVRLSQAALDVDLDRLAAGDIFGDEFTPMLEVSGFLDGFEIPDAAEFMYWKERQEARWLPAIRDALVRLIDRCRRTGDFRRIEEVAERMFALDELSEEAVRAKMEARAFAGDRIGALKIFESWKDTLAEELRAAPSPLVEGMAIRLRRRGWERTTTIEIPTVLTDQWKNRPFIGRTAEYRALYEGWERTQRGEPGHAVVLGDSGIGKTTLVERLTTAAGLEGAVISRVQCYEPDREIPYAALGALIHGLLDRPGASATPPEALAELARTVPEVRRRFPSIPPPVESEGETARIRLTEAFHELVTAIAEEHPVILVLDDLHRADDATVAVLHLVLRRATGQPLMLAMLARPGELDDAPQASYLLERSAQLGIERLELPPMSDGECDQLITSFVPSDQAQPSAVVRRALIAAAAGYPMVLELLVRDWQSSGDGCLAIAIEAMTTELQGGDRGAPVAAYRQILERITRSLDPTSRNVLNLAAILGRQVNDLSMYALADLTMGQTMTGMARLVEVRVLRDGSQGLEFVNELVRAHAYLAVPSPLRTALHGQIADRLLAREASGTKVSGLELAWHCTRAGRLEEATPYLLRGARESIDRGAPHEAERGLSTAMGHLAGNARTEAQLLLVEALQEQARWEESLEVLEKITAEGDRSTIERKYIYHTSALRRLGRFDQSELRHTLESLHQLIEGASTNENKARAALIAASTTAELRDRQLARDTLAHVDRIATDNITNRDLSRLLLAKALLSYYGRRTDASLDYITEAAELLERQELADSTLALVHVGLGATHASKGQYLSAASFAMKAYHMAIGLGNDRIACHAANNASVCYGRLGDHATQWLWSERALSLHDRCVFTGHMIHVAWSAATALAMTGRVSEAEEMIHSIERKARGNETWVCQAYILYSADIHLLIGKIKEAFDLGREGTTGRFGKLLDTGIGGPFARWVTLCAFQKGQYHDAITQLDMLIDDLSAYDAEDQLEILTARTWLRQHTGVGNAPGEAAIHNRLSELLSGVNDQLQRFGTLAFSSLRTANLP